MLGDACNFSVKEKYENGKWVENEFSEPTLFISTELEIEECQTMALAFISGVNESHILDGEYYAGEEERVIKAAHILAEAPLYIEFLPDFSIRDVESSIKKHIRKFGCKYVAHDYIQSTPKILAEISKQVGKVKLREDNILFMLSAKLKDLANQYGIFILTGTQLNGNWKENKEPGAECLSGAKSIINRMDAGEILMPLNDVDREMIAPLVEKLGCPMPNMYRSVYKNRRGELKGVRIWCVSDLGTCRTKTLFITDHQYNYIEVKETKIGKRS